MNRDTARFNPAALPQEYLPRERSSATGENRRFLLPGQMVFSSQPTTVTTILGSCVALCLWSPRIGVGGINHYLLPEGTSAEANRLRYGNHANPALLSELLALGCQTKDLQAKVFGGASMMAGVDPAVSLGKRNMELALDFVKENRILLVSKHVSEQRGCKLIFQTNNGVTLLKTFEDE